MKSTLHVASCMAFLQLALGQLEPKRIKTHDFMKRACFPALTLFLFLSSVGWGNQCPALLKTPEETKTFGELRVRAIKGWDRLITWALAPQNPPFFLEDPLDAKKVHLHSEALKDFVKNYGYFSIHHPIVGIVSEEERDLQVTECLLKAMGEQVANRVDLQFAVSEVLAKVLAYREIKKGMKIAFPVSKATIQTYLVDEVIDLWRGMPAFGLVPAYKNGVAPILLFRGTDLNLTSEKGWASILSDLDPSGPGHVTFLRARHQIHKWLQKVSSEYEPARALGFSLGGVFVLYTLIYEGDLLSQEKESIAFNPPGISKETLNRWEALKNRPPHTIYVNKGDFVSSIGFFPNHVWELSLPNPMGVIQAHVSLISAHPEFTMAKVDVAEENKRRSAN